MRLLEYQSKKLLSNFGLAFTESTPVESMDEVRATVERVGLPVGPEGADPFRRAGERWGGEVCRDCGSRLSLRQRRCSEWTCAAQPLSSFRLNRG